MKRTLAFLIFGLTILACKSDKSTTEENKVDESLSIAEKIAYAHGYEHWDKVTEIRFTFKVDRDSVKGKGRTWIWKPKSDSISLSTSGQNFKYKQSDMDSTHIAADRAFINDKFWLFIPFQLVWDVAADISEPKTVKGPIHNEDLQMITLNYRQDKGGYTPGDAYDIYYDNEFIIREWVFRKGNAQEPTLTTTFENYKEFNGIKLAMDHKRPNGNWNLNFTDVSITLE